MDEQRMDAGKAGWSVRRKDQMGGVQVEGGWLSVVEDREH